MKLYSPPNNGIPQEIPDRWRFDDGSVYTNLASLSDYELALLDWVGPYEYPVAKQVKNDGSPVTEDYDYDPETHKVAWFKYYRKYIILEKNVDEIPYQDGELILPVDAPDWTRFQTVAVSMIDLNQYVAQILPVAPLIAMAIPITIRDMVMGSYREFATIWNSIEKLVPPPSQLIDNIIALAKDCNLPEEFISIFTLED
jgi:hypothetical protein